MLAVVFLNTVLSVTAIWPTIFVKPAWLLSREFVVLVVMLSVWLLRIGSLSARAVWWLSTGYAAMVLAHYADVVVPHLLGRPVNLYWDIPQIPRFLWVSAKGNPWWVSVLAVVVVYVVSKGFHAALRWSWQRVLVSMAPAVKRIRYWMLLSPFCIVAAINFGGVQASWQYVAKPVIPTYWNEILRLWDAFSPYSINSQLPPSTVIDEALTKPEGQALAALKGRDLTLIYLETYGSMLYDNPEAVAATEQTRLQWEKSIVASGKQIVSAFYTSPTFGGATDLAQMSVLSGIDLALSNPRRHDLLLTTNRPTLLKVFQREGYEVFGLYHSVAWDWVERSYYGFDVYLSGPDLGYQGPAFGFWKIPDQFALPRMEQLYPRTQHTPARMTLFSTISTHFPFFQVPPYQPNWKRVLSDHPFDEADVAKAQAEQVNWGNMRPDYFRTVNYSNTWLAGYFQQPEPRETIYLMIGDHQPTGSVTGEGASWDVPVYIASRDAALLKRFLALGFSKGMTPKRQSLGGLHDLTGTLLKGFGDADVYSDRLTGMSN